MTGSKEELKNFLMQVTEESEEAEVERIYENLQGLLELTPEKVLFIIGDWNAKVGSQETSGSFQFMYD